MIGQLQLRAHFSLGFAFNNDRDRKKKLCGVMIETERRNCVPDVTEQ